MRGACLQAEIAMRHREDMLLLALRADARRRMTHVNRAARGVVRGGRQWSIAAADWLLARGDEVTTSDVRGVVFRPRYDVLTLMRACCPRLRDARGRAVVIATTRMTHLAKHRRERLWSVRAAISHDMNAVVRRTRLRASAGLLLGAMVLYAALLISDDATWAAPLRLPAALTALGCLAGACATPLHQPCARVRRRIVLSHARCACCLEGLSRELTSGVTRCGLCDCAWPSDEVGEADGEHHRCDDCAYDLSGLHEPHCPECGAATGRVRRAA
jgi:hypothetical protein